MNFVKDAARILRPINLAISVLVLQLLAPASLSLAQSPKSKDASNALFASEKIMDLQIRIAEKDIAEINRDERPYVPAELVENGQVVYRDFAIKLKGAAGSFRMFEDRPALTIKTNRTNKDLAFHGLVKFHLNNSVQDESYLNEYICASIFASTEYPTTRVTFARLRLNDRDVGLYVLKEGFDTRFLARHFKSPWGNLYDGGFLQDIDAELEKDDGDGPNDRSDLQKLATAAKLSEPLDRWKAIEDLVSIDHFLTFMALERMTSHWDGYCLQSNNYRLYFDSKSKKAIFLPHGMDQMFGDPGMQLWNHPNPLISKAVMQNNSWRQQYRKRVELLLPKLEPQQLWRKIDAVQTRLQPVLQSINRDQANHQAGQVVELKRRIAERYANILIQLLEPDPTPMEIEIGNAVALMDWYPVVEAGQAELAVVDQVHGKQVKAYKIQFTAEPPLVASWRKTILLGPGKYRCSAKTMLENYQPAENEPEGIRLTSNLIAVESVQNNFDHWGKQSIEFEIEEDQCEVEVIVELRAAQGTAYFDVEAMKLEKLD
ncbi:MAG: CotH kinase family protein [Pirellulales bacterium]